MEVSSGNNDEDDDENKGVSSPKIPCTNPICNCPCHKNNGPLVPPTLPAPSAMGGYLGDGSTQFAKWENY